MLPTRATSLTEMSDCIAIYRNLEGISTDFPEYGLPGYARTIFNILGTQGAAEHDDDGGTAPARASLHSTPSICDDIAGFNLVYVRCAPGNGTPDHNHNTNETFVVLDGRWRFLWRESSAEQPLTEGQFELGPRDVISFPALVVRRFECIEGPTGVESEEATLLGIVAGKAPFAEYSDDFSKKLRELGRL